MTLTHIQDRVTPTERVAVRCVDSDVHPVPRRGTGWTSESTHRTATRSAGATRSWIWVTVIVVS